MAHGDQYRRAESFETLERLKRWPKLKGRFPLVRIYSREHNAYWRNFQGNGYVSQSRDAEFGPIEEAFKRTRHAGPEKRICFEPVTLTTCPQCMGKKVVYMLGKCGPGANNGLVELSCLVCLGKGRVEDADSLTIKIG